MTLSTAEIESTRFHLGWGNVAVGALPYTQDGYWSIFDSIVSPYLGTGTETSATTAITAGSTTVVTPVAMTGIDVYGKLVVDTDDQLEIVTVKAADVTTFTAYFTKAHTDDGYPIATMSGKARLRMLLREADQAWHAISGVSVAGTSGLKSVDKNDVVWQTTGSSNIALAGRMNHYGSICQSISALVRVPMRGAADYHRVMLEAF
jgi:hypothetical protein